MPKERDLNELVEKTKPHSEKGLETCLRTLPQSLLVFRLSLGVGQRGFLKILENSISQPMLIRHENGRTKRMSNKLAQEIAKHLSKYKIDLNWEEVLKNYKRFKSMQKGHLTPKEARKLQKLWQKKTTREQRQEWGLRGARVTATKVKFTKTESVIRNMLDQLKIQYHRNKTIQINDKIYFSVDFLIEKEKFVVIEVTEKQNNLTLTAQALAFRSSEIKTKFPNSVFIAVVPKDMSLLGKNVLETKCDKVFLTNEIEALKGYLSDHFFRET